MLLPNGILGGLGDAARAGGGVRHRRLRRAASPKASARWWCAQYRNRVAGGARYALIGPNGAGKTTLINLITGMLRPDAGRIFLGDEDITALAPDQRVRRGLARTFQINSLFPASDRAGSR